MENNIILINNNTRIKSVFCIHTKASKSYCIFLKENILELKPKIVRAF